MRSFSLRRWPIALALALWACGEPVPAGVDAGPIDAGPQVREYAHVPPGTDVPEALRGDAWRTHWVRDIRPFWTMEEALGTPAGNYPTYRTMKGLPAANGTRYPRMMGRQIYAYAMGYALTGDDTLLEHARAGVEWLRTKAKDARGGYHAQLNADGTPKGEGTKWAQDLSYDMLGFAAWHYVTRDPAAEAELLAARDLLFDAARYWDADHKRIKDGLSADLATEADSNNDGGGWELVAQLDPINAFLLLSQPVLSDAQRREQFLGDLRTLGTTILANFKDPTGVFWGTTTRKGFQEKHVDFGHTLKSYWMLLQIDKRLPDHPFQLAILDDAAKWLDFAYDEANGRWGKRPVSLTEIDYGSDWWIYAEADQFAATLNLLDRTRTTKLATTAGHWVADWVDEGRVGELLPSIRRDGSPGWSWSDGDTAKCNEWKSGYHSTEHALVLYLTGRDLESQPASLWFAVPAATAQTFAATPYVFQGRETARTESGDVVVGERSLRKVRVDFAELY